MAWPARRPSKRRGLAPAWAVRAKPPTLTQRTQARRARLEREGLRHVLPTLRPLTARSTAKVTFAVALSVRRIVVPTGGRLRRLALLRTSPRVWRARKVVGERRRPLSFGARPPFWPPPLPLPPPGGGAGACTST